MCISVLIILLIIDLCFILLFIRNLISASLWVTGMFLISSVSYLAYIDYFVTDITLKTMILIQGSIIFCIFGEICGTKVRLRVRQKKSVASSSKSSLTGVFSYKKIVPRTIYIYTVSLFILGVGAYRFYDMYKYTRTLGNSSIFNTVFMIRGLFTADKYSVSVPVQLLTSLCEGFAYVSLFYFFYNAILFKVRKTKLLLPVISYFLLLISTTGRTAYMKFFIISIGVVYVFLKMSGLSKSIMNKKLFRYSIVAVALLVAVFFFYGAFIRKSNRTFLKYFADYFAVGTFGLDYMVKNPWHPNEIFGQYTLGNLYYYINKLGANFNVPEHHLEFFFWENGKSNIYTALALPMQDYGVVGLFITRFILTFIYGQLSLYVVKQKNMDKLFIPTIIFGYFLYVFFFHPIADRAIEFLTVTSFPTFLMSLCAGNKLFRRSARRNG